MRDAIRQMLTCDTVAFLADWRQPRGANVEIALATHLGMGVIKQAGSFCIARNIGLPK